MNKIYVAKQLIKIAKNIISRSQIVKKCKIDKNNQCTCYIEQSIFLSNYNYNYGGLKLDVKQFENEINRQFKNINFGVCKLDDIKLDISENDLLVLSYQATMEITEEIKQMIRNNQWRIGDELH